MRELGVRAYPTAVLIDPSGTVVWKGHPSQLDEKLLTRHIQGAFQKPVWSWPKAAGRVRKALEKREYGKALAELDELANVAKLANFDEELAAIRSALESIVAKRMATAETVLSEGDYLGASDIADELQGEMKGLPREEARAAEIRATLRADENAQRVIRLQQELRELKATRLERPDDARDLIVEVQELAEKAAGTYAAKQAAELVTELRAMLGR